MKRFEIKVYRSITTVEKEWYTVKASSFEEAKELIKDNEAEYVDGKCLDVVDGEFIDEDEWVITEEVEI